ncbi:hypothetical protein I6I42_05165 [Morganella morganii]|uniref:hypothetical protein n=1 Tax=Morganella morganii TaxID=582 RepID=UPI00191CC0F8|nr:hypothetical protein [Morganella morganii]QQU41833.1 hypothetical protein I6I42_05165 [Morganella morganii]
MNTKKPKLTGLLLLLLAWFLLIGVTGYIAFIADWPGKIAGWSMIAASVTTGLYLMHLSDKIRDKHRRD